MSEALEQNQVAVGGGENVQACEAQSGLESGTQSDIADGGEVESQNHAILAEPKIDKYGRAYATGKRKGAVARVWIKPGKGVVNVNKRDLDDYFGRAVLRMIVKQPFQHVGKKGVFDVRCNVRGGGLSGQAGAIKHAISKALSLYQPDLRAVLKKGGFLTRDARIVERKKYGHRKARRSFQFSKR